MSRQERAEELVSEIRFRGFSLELGAQGEFVLSSPVSAFRGGAYSKDYKQSIDRNRTRFQAALAELATEVKALLAEPGVN